LAATPALPKSFEEAARHQLAVEQELERVCGSAHFRTSKRSCEFLQYVVRVTLDGRIDSLKERSIGIDLFGRDTSYEPSSDATVRVRANEVRKRLSSYYSSSPAVAPAGTLQLRIDLPTGSYVPRFLPPSARPAVSPVAGLASAQLNHAASHSQSIPPIQTITLMAPALLALIVCTLLLRNQLENREEYLRFWDHLLSGRSNMVLSIPAQDRVSLASSLYPVVWVAGRYGVNATVEGDALTGSSQETPASIQVSFKTPAEFAHDERLRWIFADPSPQTLPTRPSMADRQNGRLHSTAAASSPASVANAATTSGWPAGKLIDHQNRFPDRTSVGTAAALLTILPEAATTLHVQGTDADAIRHLLYDLAREASFPTGIVDRLDNRHTFQVLIHRDSSGNWQREVFSGGA
jgi:hypothetical protein